MGHSLTFLAPGSAVSSAAESSLSSLSYPPKAPNAGADTGAGRFLLVSDVGGGFGDTVMVDATVGPVSAADVAGEGAADSTGVVFGSDTGFKSLAFMSFFLITPLSSDLTVFFGGAVALCG